MRQDPITHGNQEATPRSGGNNKQREDSRGRAGNTDAEGGDPEKKRSPIPPPPFKPTRSRSHSRRRSRSRSHSRRRSNSKGGDRQRGGNRSEGRERGTKERGNSPNRGGEATRPGSKFDISRGPISRARMGSRERIRYDKEQDDLKRAAGRGNREGNTSSSKLPYGLPGAGFRHGQGETILDGVLAGGRHYAWEGHSEDCTKRDCVQCDMLKGWAFKGGKM